MSHPVLDETVMSLERDQHIDKVMWSLHRCVRYLRVQQNLDEDFTEGSPTSGQIDGRQSM
jgi:hypothetical protein